MLTGNAEPATPVPQAQQPQGLADLLFGANNGFAQWADNNQNLLGAIGAGLAKGPTFAQGLSEAAQMAPAARRMDLTQNQSVKWLQAKYPEIASAVETRALTPAQGISFAFQQEEAARKPYTLSPGDTLFQNGKAVFTAPNRPAASPAALQEYAAAKQQGYTGSFIDFLTATKGSNYGTAFGSGPMWKDAQGNLHQGQWLRNGGVEEFSPPGGGQVVVPLTAVNQGTQTTLVNSRTGAPTTSLPTNNYQAGYDKAAGAAAGNVVGKVQAGLPVAAQTAQNAINTIEKLKADTQGIDATFGTYGVGPIQIPDQYGITLPQSKKADYQALLDQAKSQAFLQSYSMLRGAGAISDAEGQKAGQAIARLNNPNLSKSAYLSALDDFETILKTGYQRLQEQAAAAGSNPATMPQVHVPGAPPAGGVPRANDPLDLR
jgi:hypothetical protein